MQWAQGKCWFKNAGAHHRNYRGHLCKFFCVSNGVVSSAYTLHNNGWFLDGGVTQGTADLCVNFLSRNLTRNIVVLNRDATHEDHRRKLFETIVVNGGAGSLVVFPSSYQPVSQCHTVGDEAFSVHETERAEPRNWAPQQPRTRLEDQLTYQ